MHRKGYTPDIRSGYLWVEELFKRFFFSSLCLFFLCFPSFPRVTFLIRVMLRMGAVRRRLSGDPGDV